MSRVLPILFSTEMVKAILDGRKTVTRRLVKPIITSKMFTGVCTDSTFKNDKTVGCFMFGDDYGETTEPRKPPYQVGDILYVRETFCPNYFDECIARTRNDNRNAYKADYNKDIVGNVVPEPKWHPSIHMPKEAARIFLKVMDIRVEQLQDMSDIDARKEGIDRKNYPLGEFIDLWKSTIKKTEIDIYGWSANPWVWVITFERCEKPSEVEINEL